MQVATAQPDHVRGAGDLLAQARGGATRYYLQDGQGSTRALADAGGAITDRYSYDAFGNLSSHQGSTPNPYLYTGQRYDARTGLYDLRARAYDPSVGRFASRDTAGFDPADPANLDRYAYAAGDPVDLYDPSGHDGIGGFAMRLYVTAGAIAA